MPVVGLKKMFLQVFKRLTVTSRQERAIYSRVQNKVVEVFPLILRNLVFLYPFGETKWGCRGCPNWREGPVFYMGVTSRCKRL
jgi:hypothetical protein